MSPIISAIIMILILSVLIVVHELGHFLAARWRGVRVLEFAIGMGPVIYKRPSKTENGTLFTIRAFPIGGFCAMEGEEKESGDPASLANASRGSRLIILFAGSVMNLLLGLLLCLVFVIPINYSYTPEVTDVRPGSDLEAYMQVGDRITSVNGHMILLNSDVGMFIQLNRGELTSFTLIRNGETIKYTDLAIEKKDFGEDKQKYGFVYGRLVQNTVGDKIELAFKTAANNCRLVWVSLGAIISGSVGADGLMGPVGMGGVVNEVITAPEISLLDRVWNLLNLMIIITLNLGIVNLLPLPALDGGRIIFVLVEYVTRRPVPVKYEALVHGIGFAAFMLLMVFIMYNDIARLIKGTLFGGS